MCKHKTLILTAVAVICLMSGCAEPAGYDTATTDCKVEARTVAGRTVWIAQSYNGLPCAIAIA